MRIALFQPEIAGNVGAVMRLGACFGVAVDLIEPMGFAWDDKRVRRSAMDYIDHVEVIRHAGFDAFCATIGTARLVLMTTKAECGLYDFAFRDDDVLLFGQESAGVPPVVADAAANALKIPLRPEVRSFNLATSAAIALGEALRQTPETADVKPLDEQQQAARDWFEALRTRICDEFEAIERESGSEARFDFIPWDRSESDGSPGGGGVRGQMNGRVFEKVGVNVSTVGGRFSPEFATSIPGAEEDPSFFATGISLVAHMANPHVPAVHMNTRFLTTTRRWFGGGADLNPALPNEEDTAAFHARLRAACAAHDPTFYDRFAKWAEEYFWIPHRNRARGVGGIFYDRLEDHFDEHFAFTRDVGEAFLDIFPRLVRQRMDTPFTDADREALLDFRGRYVEFNLLYDRGTLFGLKTGGNIDAILMSLPPLARWA